MGFDGNVDALTVGVSGTNTTFDFEAETGCSTDCYVNATSGNDAFGGDSLASAKKTIQAAVAQVATGGTVHVAAGSYTGPIAVGRSMTLLGAQAGNDPVPGRIASESTITGLVTLQAPNVTVDGFTLTNPVSNGSVQSGLLKTAASGALIQNNIIAGVGSATNTGNSHAIYLERGPDDVQVLHNVIRNVASLTQSVSAILIGDSVSTDPSLNVTIQGNAISNIKSGNKGAYGISVSNGANVAPGPTRGYAVVKIQDNTIDDLAGGTNPSSLSGWAHAIGLEGDTPGVIVTGNAISNVLDLNPTPSPDAIAVYFESNQAFTSAQVTNNTFDNVVIGIGVSPTLLSANIQGAVVGSCNWWGDASGANLLTFPAGVLTGPGVGSVVAPQVTYAPWKTAQHGPCTGGLPACAAGSYRANPVDVACTLAPVGTYVPSAGATSAFDCPVGTFSDVQGATTCQLAPAGSYVSQPGSTSATLCSAGTYSATAGAASCDMAPLGTAVPNSGATSATPCDPGFFSDVTGAIACKPSPAGSFVQTAGQASATLCPAGYYQDQAGQTACVSAPAGYRSSIPGAVAPVACAPGSFSATAGSTSCTFAPAGSFVSQPHATSATHCPAGKYQPLTGQQSCLTVPAGYFSAIGAAEATACPVGTYADHPGSSSCDDRYKFDFNVRETSRETGRFSLEINYGKVAGVDKKGRPTLVQPDDATFRSTGVTFVAFSDDPTIRPGRSTRPQVDTVLFTGVGQWNGRSGYTFEVRAVDQGEPGRHRESITITIRDAAGAIVAQASGDLASGNVQSERIKH